MGISPAGANRFEHQGFTSRQKLLNHWRNGRTHEKEYPDFTMEQYEQRAIELLEQPTGENILGHADKDNHIVRYDKRTNDFAKGHPQKGVITMFKPKDGEDYYYRALREDLKHGGRT